jgi:hypothetical protein
MQVVRREDFVSFGRGSNRGSDCDGSSNTHIGSTNEKAKHGGERENYDYEPIPVPYLSLRTHVTRPLPRSCRGPLGGKTLKRTATT